MMEWQNIYNYYIVELSDPLTRNWPLIDSPFKVIFITLAYLYFVLNFGPRYMKNKSPYKLRTFILIYNIIQILANFWLTKEYTNIWFTNYSFICSTSVPTAPSAIKIFNLIWWTLLLKIFDYLETCVFVLRKKQNQVSTLHVYHHVSNVFFGWYYLKYVVDERGAIIIMINCFVHIFMYIYYFLAAWNPKLQKSLLPIKPYITKIQLVQFFAILILMLQLLLPYCNTRGHERISIVFFINIIIFIYLFYDFYKKNYITPKQKQN